MYLATLVNRASSNDPKKHNSRNAPTLDKARVRGAAGVDGASN